MIAGFKLSPTSGGPQFLTGFFTFLLLKCHDYNWKIVTTINIYVCCEKKIKPHNELITHTHTSSFGFLSGKHNY